MVNYFLVKFMQKFISLTFIKCKKDCDIYQYLKLFWFKVFVHQ